MNTITRINVVNPNELNGKHLIAEIHEITRIYGLVRKAQERKINKYNFKEKIKQPSQYTLGAGHVYWFYDKLEFITKRYYALCSEAISRGYKISPISEKSLTEGIEKWWFGDYIPTQEAVDINKQRIEQRLKEMKK